MRYAAIIPCSSAAPELERVADLLDALEVLDGADCVVALVINDGNPGLANLPSRPLLRIVDNPRQGQGWGWAGGLIAAELWSFWLLLREYSSLGCVVKFDTDALPIKPLAAGLETIFADPQAGYAGERAGYDPFAANGDTSPRPDRQRSVRKLRAPLSLWRMPHWHFRCALAGRHRWIAQLFDVAEQHGYQPGDVVEGGTCAFSGECLHLLDRLGILDRWRDFLDIATGDDVILTMLPYLVGMRAVSAPLFSPGEQQALKFAPEALLSHPVVGAVHSVKRFGEFSEAQLRRIFREARRGEAKA